MSVIRAFIAISLSSEIHQRLNQVLSSFKKPLGWDPNPLGTGFKRSFDIEIPRRCFVIQSGINC